MGVIDIRRFGSKLRSLDYVLSDENWRRDGSDEVLIARRITDAKVGRAEVCFGN